MMAVEISEETRQIIEVPVPISLPKWAWLIITSRAKALHEGDIDACVQELLNVASNLKSRSWALSARREETDEPLLRSAG